MSEFAPLLERYPSPWTSARIHRVASGFSGSEIWKVECPAGIAALRRWNAAMSPRRLSSIHVLIAAVAAEGFEIVATPIASTDGASWYSYDGALWELSRWMPGEADRSSTPSVARIRAAAQAIARWRIAADRNRSLTALHHLGDREQIAAWRQRRQVVSPAIARRLAELRRLRDRLEGKAHALFQGAETYRGSSAARRTYDALCRSFAIDEQLQATFRGPLCIALVDVHRDHVLFVGEVVTGLVDFGAVAIDAPAVDLARLLGSLAADNRSLWAEGFAAYQELAPLEPHDFDHAWLLYRSGTLIAALRWLEWLILERRRFADPEAAWRRWESLLDQLERWDGIK